MTLHTPPIGPEPVTLVVVDDDLGEARAVRRSFAKACLANPILHVYDGVEALELLRGAEAPVRFILLVDLNMPRMNGIELVGQLRRDLRLMKSVVFMLTTSDDRRDIASAYELNVAGYVQKSRVGPDFRDLIGLLARYGDLVEMPAIARAGAA